MRLVTMLVLALALLTGCSATNISSLVEQLAKDPAANCIQVGTPYGSIMLARGTPQASVTIGAGTCVITGAGVTTIQVPQSNLSVTPPPTLPRVERQAQPLNAEDGRATIKWLLRHGFQ